MINLAIPEDGDILSKFIPIKESDCRDPLLVIDEISIKAATSKSSTSLTSADTESTEYRLIPRPPQTKPETCEHKCCFIF